LPSSRRGSKWWNIDAIFTRGIEDSHAILDRNFLTVHLKSGCHNMCSLFPSLNPFHPSGSGHRFLQTIPAGLIADSTALAAV
jgi:hypothetical protein